MSVEEYKEVRDQMIGEIEQEKEAIVAEVEPLRELKTGIDEIDTTGTKLPFGVVAIKKKDLEAVFGLYWRRRRNGKLKVFCSVGGDGISRKKEKSRASRGGDFRKEILPRTLTSL